MILYFAFEAVVTIGDSLNIFPDICYYSVGSIAVCCSVIGLSQKKFSKIAKKLGQIALILTVRVKEINSPSIRLTEGSICPN